MNKALYINSIIESGGSLNIFKFLKYVLRIGNAEDIYNDIKINGNKNDEYIYNLVQYNHSPNKLSFMHQASLALSFQTKLLANQTFDILGRKQINGYLSIGDPGRYINELRKKINIKGNIYIAHDKTRFQDFIETGSIFELGKHVHLDYTKLNTLNVPHNSIELITCYIGLHHFPKEKLGHFVYELYKILKPNGVLIFRDHDGTDINLPIIHTAHNLYNSIIGEPIENNRKEYRNFQPMSFWINLMKLYKFRPIEKKLLQKDDPTMNYLMGFIKIPNYDEDIPQDIINITTKDETYERPLNQTYQTVPEWLLVDITKEYANYMHHTPWYVFPYFKALGVFWRAFYLSSKYTYKYCGFGGVFSPYTIMNLFIGIVMTIIFIILWILAILPSMMYGNTEIDTVQAIIYNKNNVDITNIKELQILKSSGKFSLIRLQRYMPFTNTVIKLATMGIKFVEISGQRKIQIKVQSNYAEEFAHEMYRYKILDDLSNEILLNIDVEDLSRTINFYISRNEKITHIYDF